MLRQLIFGLLKPQIQSQIQQSMIQVIINVLNNNDIKMNILQISNDEVIFENSKNDPNICHQIKKILDQEIDFDFRIENFTLDLISKNESWFIRRLVDQPPENGRLTGVHVKFLFQVYNHINKRENKKKDFWWRERGRLCALLDPEKFD